jgi:sarcosine oxidase subunit alpha
MMERLPSIEGEAIERDRPISFAVDGRRLRGYEGDTIASAMLAAGITITGRSFKYHRPRGVLCMTGCCPNCLVTVDGIPNVRACTEPLREGMRVQRQNAWPSAERDLLGVLDRLSFMMPPGFYYKVFQRPRWAWPKVEPLIRVVAGLGRLPRVPDHDEAERQTLYPDVLVIGGGPAGLAAAAEAARAGARTILIEQRSELGGHLLWTRDGRRTVAALTAEATEAGAVIHTSTPAFGLFDGPIVAAAGRGVLYRIRPRRIVVATGAVPQPTVFPNNDLPGVMLASAAGSLVHRYRVLPGRTVVVWTCSDEGHEVAETLRGAGADVTLVDLREDVQRVPSGVAFIPGRTIVRAIGRRRVRAVEVGPPGGRGDRTIPCDLLVIAGVNAPSAHLLAMAGTELRFDEPRQIFVPTDLPPHVGAAGRVTGTLDLEAEIAQGRIAGLEAAAALGLGPADLEEPLADRRAAAEAPQRMDPLPPARSTGDGKQFACLCMDVTDKELKTAVREGFDSLELLKRYTTITMGPCQGKACLLASQRLCAAVTGRSPAEVRPTTVRAPWTPVELGVLAGPRSTPRKETTLHDVHTDLGATFMWAGDWRRPHHYTDVRSEVEAVRTRVGLIDVSTLGKFRIRGPQAVDLLERIYPCRVSDLAPGRIRYAAMLNDEGVILDDGTILRLEDDEFFVTVTTGNTAGIERWITWWLADWQLDVHVLNVTGAFAAVNLAGPRAREVLARLTDADLSPASFPYMAGRRMEVAGVGCVVLRLGFVGELGYEIHFPSMYGEYLWERLMEAGRGEGIAPFGLEAQRVLRLEKQHILVGQDTDAESDPYEVGLGWMVKADKPDFLGKRALADLEQRVGERLVGFVAEGTQVPPEGSAVVQDGRWAGRVTSARWSAAAGGVVGLAWVPAAWAVEGTPFDIRWDTTTISARVHLRPFYDPEGARLRA